MENVVKRDMKRGELTIVIEDNNLSRLHSVTDLLESEIETGRERERETHRH